VSSWLPTSDRRCHERRSTRDLQLCGDASLGNGNYVTQHQSFDCAGLILFVHFRVLLEFHRISTTQLHSVHDWPNSHIAASSRVRTVRIFIAHSRARRVQGTSEYYSRKVPQEASALQLDRAQCTSAPAKDDDMHLTIGRGLLNLPDAGKLQWVAGLCNLTSITSPALLPWHVMCLSNLKTCNISLEVRATCAPQLCTTRVNHHTVLQS
jgi:hypothetical protein